MIDDSTKEYIMDSSEVANQPPMSEDEDQNQYLNQYFDDSKVTLPRQWAWGNLSAMSRRLPSCIYYFLLFLVFSCYFLEK